MNIRLISFVVTNLCPAAIIRSRLQNYCQLIVMYYGAEQLGCDELHVLCTVLQIANLKPWNRTSEISSHIDETEMCFQCFGLLVQ